MLAVDTVPMTILTDTDKATLAQSIGKTLRQDLAEHCGGWRLFKKREVTLYALMNNCHIASLLLRRQECRHTTVNLPPDNTAQRETVREITHEVLESILKSRHLPYVAKTEVVEITNAYDSYGHGRTHAIRITLTRSSGE